MVRKPANSATGQIDSSLPYPVTPVSPIERSVNLLANSGGMQSQRLADRARGGDDMPKLARPRPLESPMNHELPPPLRVGEGLPGSSSVCHTKDFI